MRTLTRQFALFFYAGFIALAVALGYSLVADGVLFAPHPLLRALRALGVGMMAAGMVFWIAQRREEGGKAGLNPLFGFLVFGGTVLLLLGLLFPQSGLSWPASMGGLAFMLAALIIGVLVAIFAPALPTPAAKQWPQEARTVLTKFAREEDEGHEHASVAHQDETPAVVDPAGAASAAQPATESAVGPDDLTVIEGIGPKLQSILVAAGVNTYAKLAAHSPEDIAAIVKAAGFRAPFNPGSWPQQADLAAQGAWEKLEALQDELVAGRVN